MSALKIRVHTRHLSPKTHSLIVLVSLITLVTTTAIASRQTLQGIEHWVFDIIYNLPQNMDFLFLSLTQLGSAWMVIILSASAFALNIKGLTHKILINGAITYLAVEYMKQIVSRPRPYDMFDSVTSREAFVTGNGFPSGHTAMATVLALTVLPYIPKRYTYIIFIWIGAVGVSRIYLGVHAPLDVIGGIALGILIASFQHLWTSTTSKRKNLKKPS